MKSAVSKRLFRKLEVTKAMTSWFSHNIRLYSSQNQSELALKELVDMKKKGLKPDVQTFTLLLNMHMRAGNNEAALALYHEWRKRLTPDCYLAAVLLSLYMKLGRFSDGEELIAELRQCKVQPDSALYDAMLTFYTRMGDPKRALALLEEMDRRNVGADAQTYLSMILLFTVLKQYETVEKVFEDLSQRGYLPNLQLYTAMIGSYLTMKRPTLAVALFNEMKAAGVQPTMVTYFKLIHLYKSESNVEEVTNLFREILERNLEISFQVFRTLLNFFAENGCDAEVRYLFDNMQSKFGLTPDRFTYGVMIRLYRNMGKPELAMEYLRLMNLQVERPESDAKLSDETTTATTTTTKTTATTTPPLTSLLRISMLHMLAKRGMVSDAEAIFAELLPEQISTALYNIMIAMYAKANRYDDAKRIYEAMQEQQVPMDSYTFSPMIESHYALQDGNGMLSLLEEAERVNVVPILYNLLLAIKMLTFHVPRAAMQQFDKMVAHHAGELTLRNFNMILSGFMKMKRVEYALKIYQTMLRLNIKPDLVTYVMLTCSLCSDSNPQALKVQQLLKDMTKHNIEPNENIYTSIISMYTALNLPTEALDTFNELLNLGIAPSDTTYCALLEALGTMNHFSDEISMISKLRELGVELTIGVYNTLLSLSAQKDPLKALRLFEMLKSQNLKPDIITYTTIITICRNLKAALANPNMNSLLALVEELLGEIAKSNIEMDLRSYYVLMTFYHRFHAHSKVDFLFKMMKSRGVRPNRRVYYVVLGLYSKDFDTPDFVWSRKYFALLDEMISLGFSLSPKYHAISVKKHLIMGNPELAMQKLEEVKTMEISSKYLVHCYRAMILFYLRRSEYALAQEWNRRLVESGLNATWKPYYRDFLEKLVRTSEPSKFSVTE